MAEISGRPGEALQRPRPRIQSLSDLIFGLALSIGALNLISNKPADTQALFGNIATFGFSFLILIFVWFRYTEIMSVLPVETTRTRALNTVMLFLVAMSLTCSTRSRSGLRPPRIRLFRKMQHPRPTLSILGRSGRSWRLSRISLRLRKRSWSRRIC